MSSPNQTFRYPPGPGLRPPPLIPSAKTGNITFYEPKQNQGERSISLTVYSSKIEAEAPATPRRVPAPSDPSLAAQQATKPPIPPLHGFPKKYAHKPNPRQGPPEVPGQQRHPDDSFPSHQGPQTLRHVRPEGNSSDIAQASRSRAKSQPPRPTVSSPQTPGQHTTVDDMHFSHRPLAEQPPSPPSATSHQNPDHEPYPRSIPTRAEGVDSDSHPLRGRPLPSESLAEPSPYSARPTIYTQRRSKSSASHSRPAQGIQKENSAQALLQQAWKMQTDRHSEEVATLVSVIID